MGLLTIVQILFYLLIGLWFLGIKFNYMDKVIGFCGILIGLVMIFGGI